MIITNKETKTFYNIRFTLSEFAQICDNYTRSTNKHKYPRAFESIAIEEVIESNATSTLINFFKEMGMIGNADLFSLIANHFGFDGWDNAGYYNLTKQCYCMRVFDYGDTINE